MKRLTRSSSALWPKSRNKVDGPKFVSLPLNFYWIFVLFRSKMGNTQDKHNQQWWWWLAEECVSVCLDRKNPKWNLASKKERSSNTLNKQPPATKSRVERLEHKSDTNRAKIAYWLGSACSGINWSLNSIKLHMPVCVCVCVPGLCWQYGYRFQSDQLDITQ